MKTENINVRVKPSTKKQLELMAKVKGKSMSKVVEQMILDASEMGLGDMAEGMVKMNDEPEIQPMLEWLAFNHAAYKAANQRFELTDEFRQSFAELMAGITGLINGMYKRSQEVKNQRINN